jgi:hypothetical protein
MNVQQIAEPMTEIEIAGRILRVGRLDGWKHAEATPDLQFFVRLMEQGGSVYSDDAKRAHARLSFIVLRDDAPDLTADWLFENMGPVEADRMAKEFQRQALERAASAGLAGRA